MKDKVGRGLAESLAEAVNDASPDTAARVMTWLTGLDGRGWLRLDESARRTYWGSVAARPGDRLAVAAGW
jgi:hypothetical protein